MHRVIAFYYMIYVVFMSNQKHLLSIEKLKKPYKFIYIL